MLRADALLVSGVEADVVCACVRRTRAEREKERERERVESAAVWRRHQEIGARSGSMASSHGRSDLRFADWMASLPQSMHTIPLTNLAIPGRFLPGSPQTSPWADLFLLLFF